MPLSPDLRRRAADSDAAAFADCRQLSRADTLLRYAFISPFSSPRHADFRLFHFRRQPFSSPVTLRRLLPQLYFAGLPPTPSPRYVSFEARFLQPRRRIFQLSPLHFAADVAADTEGRQMIHFRFIVRSLFSADFHVSAFVVDT